MIQSIKQDNVLDYGQKMPYCITNIMSSKDIEATLKENFDEYETDETNLRIATEAIDDLQHVRFSVANGPTQKRGGRSNSQIYTVGKGITSELDYGQKMPYCIT